jgi:hypothetical protein|tara:strand:+ start:1961 stop:2077 length:117 start_codon:yes stop_codon:yes gene_type:complete
MANKKRPTINVKKLDLEEVRNMASNWSEMINPDKNIII